MIIHILPNLQCEGRGRSWGGLAAVALRLSGIARFAYEDCRGEKKTRVMDVCDVQVARINRLYHGRERGDGANKGGES